MAPAQLSDHMVLVVEQVSDLHRMVPSCNKTDVMLIVCQHCYNIASTIKLYIKSICFFKICQSMVISMRFVSDYKKLLKLVHVLIAKHVLLIFHYCTSTSLQVSQWFYFYTRLYQVKKVP